VSTLKSMIERVRVDPPGKPEISGYSSEQVLKTGDTAKLECVSRGGNPLAQVYWYRDGVEVDFSYETGGGRARNELLFTVEPSDNNAVYRCAASNQMTAQPLTTDIRLTVHCTTIESHRSSQVASDHVRLGSVHTTGVHGPVDTSVILDTHVPSRARKT